MFSYGFMPTGGAMLAVGIVHALCDGFTVSSTAVGVGMVAPAERRRRRRECSALPRRWSAASPPCSPASSTRGAGARWRSRGARSSMVALVVGAWLLAGPEHRARRGQFDAPIPSEPGGAIDVIRTRVANVRTHARSSRPDRRLSDRQAGGRRSGRRRRRRRATRRRCAAIRIAPDVLLTDGGSRTVFGSYGELIESPEVDAVYIGTPASYAPPAGDRRDRGRQARAVREAVCRQRRRCAR